MAIFFFFFKDLFIAELGLHCHLQAFSSCREQGYSSVCGLLISLMVGATLGSQALIVMADVLSCSAPCGIFLDQESNPSPGFKPKSPALAGRFLTTRPPWKPS